MPTPLPRTFPHDRRALMDLGVERMKLFCAVNDLPIPAVYVVDRGNWHFDACAFYRPDDKRTQFLMADRKDGLGKKGYGPGINICLESCTKPCGVEGPAIQQSWPGSITDREPYGVILHEFGHHLDWLAGENKGTYYSEFSTAAKAEAGESGITSYANTNPAEWFAEACRLYVANHALLRAIRPRTYAVLAAKWQPVGTDDWRAALGANVPPRVIGYLTKKGAR